jgi:hypothetical protein
VGVARCRHVTVLTAITLVLAAPWLAQVPASLARWRVTGDWLSGPLMWPDALLTPFRLAASLLGAKSDLGGWQQGDIVLLVIVAAVLVLLARLGSAKSMWAPRVMLLWVCWIAASAGPIMFDLARGTTTSTISRYFLPGLPAAVLLGAVAISRLPRLQSAAILAAVLLAWLPGTWKASRAPVPRPNEPYTVLDRRLEAWAQPGDLVLVRSLPSGVIGVARYLKRDIPLVAWVTQLGTRRTPADLERVLRGRRRVALATIHAGGAADPVQPWLEANARLLGRDTFRRSSAEILYFAPLQGETFFAPREVATRWE